MASFGSFVLAQSIEEKAMSDPYYSKDTETGKPQLDTDVDLSKRDIRVARKQSQEGGTENKARGKKS